MNITTELIAQPFPKVNLQFGDFKYNHLWLYSKFPTSEIFKGFIRKDYRCLRIRYAILKPLIRTLGLSSSQASSLLESLWYEGQLIKLTRGCYRIAPVADWKSKYRGHQYINTPTLTPGEQRLLRLSNVNVKWIPNWQCQLDFIGLLKWYQKQFYTENMFEVAEEIKQQRYPVYVLRALRVLYKKIKSQKR